MIISNNLLENDSFRNSRPTGWFEGFEWPKATLLAKALARHLFHFTCALFLLNKSDLVSNHTEKLDNLGTQLAYMISISFYLIQKSNLATSKDTIIIQWSKVEKSFIFTRKILIAINIFFVCSNHVIYSEIFLTKSRLDIGFVPQIFCKHCWISCIGHRKSANEYLPVSFKRFFFKMYCNFHLSCHNVIVVECGGHINHRSIISFKRKSLQNINH